eukprot:3141755-Prymnesium_polylepis.1
MAPAGSARIVEALGINSGRRCRRLDFISRRRTDSNPLPRARAVSIWYRSFTNASLCDVTR